MSSFFEVFAISGFDPDKKKLFDKVKVNKITRVTSGNFIRVETESEIFIDNESIQYAQDMISKKLLGNQISVFIKNTPNASPEKVRPVNSPSAVSAQASAQVSSPASSPASPAAALQIKAETPASSSGTQSNTGHAAGSINDIKTKIDENGYEYISMSDLASAVTAPSASYSPGGSSEKKYYSGDKKYVRKKKETDPGMLYGKEVEGVATPVSDIEYEMKNVTIDGEICANELTITKKETKILKIDVTDFVSTISVKFFLADGEEDLVDKLAKGLHVRINGRIEYDNYEGEIMMTHVNGVKKIDAPFRNRQDKSARKRVELHLHTRFSDMDATTDISKLLKRATSWGHKSLAITDHGVVQGFPVAFHALQDIQGAYKKKGEELDFKLIYGCEGYIVDDSDMPVLKETDGDVEPIRLGEDGTPEFPSPYVKEAITAVKKKHSHHIILLAANEVGRVNLYRLVSFSHINYFSRRPRIPKSVLNRYREGLIIGSACVAGEIMDAILSGESEERLHELVDYYDYLEIQPTGNNAFLIRNWQNNAKGHKIKDVEGLRDLNRRVLELGDRYGKKVVATGDVHFLDPEDEIFRTIILDSQNFEDSDDQAPLYFRTTEEMLDEFAYLGEDRAREVVIDNTNLIADSIEYIEPVRPDKCPPVIENSDQKLTDMVFDNARKMYGDPLPGVVQDRLDRELHSIISNGYAVLYIIAMELVTQSVRDGYLVGSRGSVGSSLVATMSNITEVNPLKPHYRCPKCLYSDFDSPEVNAFAGGAGCDMPDRLCPVCGEPLLKDGFDIPFETFMGFKGDKEPDIDLNFSGEYQARAHANTEKLFGKGHTFRAGTISALQDKTVYGYVHKYMQKHNKSLRKCEVNRIIQGCVDVKRSTGQHPGGIVVLPHGEEIYSFTPIQHPANDATKNIITTHFEYHSIDHNLLKLDELGHDDPTMIKMLEDLTGFSAKKVKFDNPDVLKLYETIEVLGVKPEDVDGYTLGTLGIPEFGTDFVMQMLKDTQPKNFSDLVRIAGLSHGTDVWLNNAQTLVQEKKATLSSCICTRDDIMLYLMQMNLEPSMAFDIMENVRKGKVAGGKVADKWEKWKAAMKEHDVPEWYMWSCERIQYMFPKAHAVAYVMMAFRIAYYKIYYPLAYYAAYFSIRAASFNYELMCRGKDTLIEQMSLIKARIQSGENTPKDEGTLKDMKSVLEMYARGFEFAPIDIYQADATKFKIVDGKIMPSFTSLDGMGDKAAAGLALAAKEGKFNSREDIQIRSKVSSTMIDKMYQLGILGNLPASSQISFSDLFKM